MKKFFSFTIILVLCFALAFSASAIEKGDFGYFDYDFDGKIELKDALNALKNSLQNDDNSSILRVLHIVKASTNNESITGTVVFVDKAKKTALVNTEYKNEVEIPFKVLGLDASCDPTRYINMPVKLTVPSPASDFFASCTKSSVYYIAHPEKRPDGEATPIVDTVKLSIREFNSALEQYGGICTVKLSNDLVVKSRNLGITPDTPYIDFLGLDFKIGLSCDKKYFTQSAYDSGSISILSASKNEYTRVYCMGDRDEIKYIVKDDGSVDIVLGDDTFNTKDYYFSSYTYAYIWTGFAQENTFATMEGSFLWNEDEGYIGERSGNRCCTIDYCVTDKTVNGKPVVEMLRLNYNFGPYTIRVRRCGADSKDYSLVCLGDYNINTYKNPDGEDSHFREHVIGTYLYLTDDLDSVYIEIPHVEPSQDLTYRGVPVSHGDFIFYRYNQTDDILDVAENFGPYKTGRLTAVNYINETVIINGQTYSFGFKNGFTENAIPSSFSDYTDKFDEILTALEAGKNNVRFVEANGNIVYLEKYISSATNSDIAPSESTPTDTYLVYTADSETTIELSNND